MNTNMEEELSNFEEAKVKIKNLEILHSIGKSISENLDLQTILQQVTDATTKLTGAAFGAFFYNNQDEEGNTFSLFTLSGAPREAFEKFGIPRHTEIFHPTFAGKKVVRIADVTKDKRYGRNAPHSGMPKGHLPVVSYLAVPVVARSGEAIGGLLFGHPKEDVFKEEHEEMVLDIASQAAISLDNSRLYGRVKELSQKKDEFIALASHELKTPLTTVKGYLQILQGREQDEMSHLFITKSLNQINKLNNLIEDLLNMSRFEAGKMEHKREIFNIKELLYDLAQTFKFSYNSHELFLSLPEEPVFVEGDQERIEQVVLNLLSNAVKYSLNCKKVYLDLKTDDIDAVISVTDKGSGLTKQQQKNLFSRFYRAENTRGIAGLGLGLYLSKQIIDRHDGIIGVESEPGRGSRFFFKIKIKEN